MVGVTAEGEVVGLKSQETRNVSKSRKGKTLGGYKKETSPTMGGNKEAGSQPKVKLHPLGIASESLSPTGSPSPSRIRSPLSPPLASPPPELPPIRGQGGMQGMGGKGKGGKGDSPYGAMNPYANKKAPVESPYGHLNPYADKGGFTGGFRTPR